MTLPGLGGGMSRFSDRSCRHLHPLPGLIFPSLYRVLLTPYLWMSPSIQATLSPSGSVPSFPVLRTCFMAHSGFLGPAVQEYRQRPSLQDQASGLSYFWSPIQGIFLPSHPTILLATHFLWLEVRTSVNRFHLKNAYQSLLSTTPEASSLTNFLYPAVFLTVSTLPCLYKIDKRVNLHPVKVGKELPVLIFLAKC